VLSAAISLEVRPCIAADVMAENWLAESADRFRVESPEISADVSADKA